MPNKFFTVRVSKEDHKRARIAAAEAESTLVEWGGQAVAQRLDRETIEKKRQKLKKQ